MGLLFIHCKQLNIICSIFLKKGDRYSTYKLYSIVPFGADPLHCSWTEYISRQKVQPLAHLSQKHLKVFIYTEYVKSYVMLSLEKLVIKTEERQQLFYIFFWIVANIS